jgi:ArsR family transcriptional regulator
MKNIEEKTQFYKALADPIRLKIIDILLNKKACTCCCELTKNIKRDQSVIFRHIQVLKDAGIINTEKKDRFLMCCLKDKDMIEKLMRD